MTRFVYFGCAIALLAASATGAQTAEKPEPVVVATVGSQAIHQSEVDRVLAKVTGNRKVNPAILPWMQAQVLEGIIDRRLVLAYAGRTKTGADLVQVDAAAAAMKAQLEAQHSSLEKFAAERGLTFSDLRREIAWDLTWKKYLTKYLTDERIASHFNAHRRNYDGTALSVSHILLQPRNDSEAIATLLKRAAAIRKGIESEKLTFETAVQKCSSGPSRANAGQLGWITRRGSMPERFSKAAFALAKGEISPPVCSHAGVHLIRCDDVKPGERELGEVRPQIEETLAKELMRKLADLQRPHSVVTYRDTAPHFKPGTKELVTP